MPLPELLCDEAGRKPFQGREVEMMGEVADEAAQEISRRARVCEDALIGGVVLRLARLPSLFGHRLAWRMELEGRLTPGARAGVGWSRQDGRTESWAEEWWDGTILLGGDRSQGWLVCPPSLRLSPPSLQRHNIAQSQSTRSPVHSVVAVQASMPSRPCQPARPKS